MAGNNLAKVTTNTTPKSNVTVETDPPQLIYLAKTIYGEARGQNHESKVAVGWTIRNRVDQQFHGARMYSQVVTARGQYDAWMKHDPNYREVQHPRNKAAWQDSLQAARDVYYGNAASNPVPDATHYYSPNSQNALHEQYPETYPAVPSFITPHAQQVPNPANVADNDFRFYKNVR